jgi:hypothetical protein
MTAAADPQAEKVARSQGGHQTNIRSWSSVTDLTVRSEVLSTAVLLMLLLQTQSGARDGQRTPPPTSQKRSLEVQFPGI